MKFVDECQVRVVAGDGGNGCVAFRREKFVPHGGPSGGDGGRGGSVVLVGDGGLSTLLDLTYAHTLKAERGEHGQGSDCYGKGGADLLVRVPVGTRVLDADTGELVGEVLEHDQKLVVAKGGIGGRGNMHFATPFDRAPRRADPGTPGESKRLNLQLMVLADVGLLGFPNVGKSTLIRAVSRARPKVADYPFTTLQPHLGIVSVGGAHDATTFAMADIPGLIPGASQGAGLGIRFLKHLERTRVLIHLVTVDQDPERDPVRDYVALRSELEAFDPELAKRPELVVVSKNDLPHVQEAWKSLQSRFRRRGIKLRRISAATKEGTSELMQEVAELVQRARNGTLFTPDEERSASGRPRKKP
ncbi:MAG: GTPase ObgE [Deltaproteobacteria bacterium]|nr:GTPase ObgE [Deltaproteobacteria bacterium]